MTKTLYYRETNPKTGKQKWIKLQGVHGTNSMVFIQREFWLGIEQNSAHIVYKTARKR